MSSPTPLEQPRSHVLSEYPLMSTPPVSQLQSLQHAEYKPQREKEQLLMSKTTQKGRLNLYTKCYRFLIFFLITYAMKGISVIGFSWSQTKVYKHVPSEFRTLCPGVHSSPGPWLPAAGTERAPPTGSPGPARQKQHRTHRMRRDESHGKVSMF